MSNETVLLKDYFVGVLFKAITDFSLEIGNKVTKKARKRECSFQGTNTWITSLKLGF